MSDSLERTREHRAGLRAAMGEVESALAAPASEREGPWRQALAEKLAGLTEALEWHIANTEGPDGLLAEILMTAPRLAHRVEKASADHTRLRVAVDQARVSAAAGAEVLVLRDQVVDLLVEVVRHRQLGADLVYEAYNVDIEAGD